MNRFDADIALRTLSEGRFRGEVVPRWSVGPGPNGGFIAALAARALEQTLTPPLRSLTLHYLAAPALGPLDVTVTTLREGRTTAFAQVEMTQGGTLKVMCLAALAPWRADAPSYADVPRPEIAPPEDCIRVEGGRPGQPEMLSNYDMRVVAPDADARPLVLGGWIRSAEPRPLDAPLIAAMTDAWLPPAIVRVPEPVAVPTIDLTIHFRAPLEDAEEHPFVQARFTSTSAGGGTTEEDGWLWSADGTLLAQSRQLAVVRRLPKA